MLPPGLRPRTYWEGVAIENRYWRSSLGPALLGLWTCFLESYGSTHRRVHTLKLTENCRGSPWWGVQRKACRQWHNTGEGLPGKWVMRKCPIQHSTAQGLEGRVLRVVTGGPLKMAHCYQAAWRDAGSSCNGKWPGAAGFPVKKETPHILQELTEGQPRTRRRKTLPPSMSLLSID